MIAETSVARIINLKKSASSVRNRRWNWHESQSRLGGDAEGTFEPNKNSKQIRNRFVPFPRRLSR